MNTLLRIATVFSAMTAATGCMSLSTPITDFATDYNRVIADTRNEMILLNILRAQHREPIYFTSVSEINGSVSVGASAGVSGNVSIDGNNATPNSGGYSGSLGVNASSSPTFSVVPLNTQEFVRGALTPVREETIALLRQQGWRGSLVAPLLIESIDCAGRESIRNDPDTFRYQPDSFQLSDFGGVRIETLSGIGERTVENGGAFQLQIADSDLVDLIFNERSGDFNVRQGARAESGNSNVHLTRRSDTRVRYHFSENIARYCGVNHAVSGSDGVTVHLRSIEGIIYFLGELRRSGISPLVTYDDRDTAEDETRYLFRLSEGNFPASVRIGYRGRSYGIPQQDGTSPDRSLQVISLLNQLLALQTSTEDLSRVTPTVRVR